MAGESRDALDLVWGRSRTTLVEKRKVFEFDANLAHEDIHYTVPNSSNLHFQSPDLSLDKIRL
jgi:hypothetical protein